MYCRICSLPVLKMESRNETAESRELAYRCTGCGAVFNATEFIVVQPTDGKIRNINT